MRRLIALHIAGGDRFVGALRAAWDNGDVVAPIDTRLPEHAVRTIISRLRPALVVTESGSHTRPYPRSMADGDALVITTSGSTGPPKSVVLNHSAVAASAQAGSDALSVDPSTDRWLACLPLSHMGGLGVVTRAVLTGTPLLAHARFEPAHVHAAAASGATLTALVPTALRRVDSSVFRAIIVGGADVGAEVPANVVESYGLTETCGGFVYDGRPFPGCEVRLDDGEILMRGPVLCDRYLDVDAPVAGEDGWFRTGDLGRFESDGRLVVEGRRNDMIITGGENVWPGSVEDVLRTDPAVHEVAVVGVADAEWGQRVVAAVEITPGATTPTLASLRDLVGERIARFAAPRQVVVVDELPRTTSGKVHRAAVRSMLESGST